MDITSRMIADDFLLQYGKQSGIEKTFNRIGRKSKFCFFCVVYIQYIIYCVLVYKESKIQLSRSVNLCREDFVPSQNHFQ